MNIVLLESLSVKHELMDALFAPLKLQGHTLTCYERTADEDTLIHEAQDADVLIIANMPLSGRVIRACKHLKFIDVAFTGVDHVDLDAAREMGVAVSNATGYSEQSVAELVIGQMIQLLRNVPAVEERCRNGGTKEGLVGSELGSSVVGIVGTGAIGSRVATLCHAFGSTVIGYDPFPSERGRALLTYVSLEELLQQADIVTLHCPLMPQTRGLIGRDQLALMKPSAYLINMARGPVVDAQAVADALNQGKLAGAAIDVFEKEPPLAADEPLLAAKKCLLTPHIAFASHQSMERRAQSVFDSLQQWMHGHQVNKIL